MRYRDTVPMLFALLVVLLLSPHRGRAQTTYSFAVVPQQPASKIAETWGPVLLYLENKTGHSFQLVVPKDIPSFKLGLAIGRYDFAYMNPYHYTLYHKKSGYNALVRASDRSIHGILIVKNDSTIQSIQDLNGKTIVFPSPSSFAASLLPHTYLKKQGITFRTMYVGSHDSVLLNVARGFYPAGGAIKRTLNFMPYRIKHKLRILWTSKGYTPHAIAARGRLSQSVIKAVRHAFVMENQNQYDRDSLVPLRIKGWVAASDSDWDDVRELNIQALE